MQQIVESLEAIIFENKKIDYTTLYVENKSQDHTSASCICDSTNDMPSDDFRLCLSQSMEENERNSDIINRVENMSILSNNIENTKTWTSRKGLSNKIDNNETCTLGNNMKQRRIGIKQRRYNMKPSQPDFINSIRNLPLHVNNDHFSNQLFNGSSFY